MQALDAYRYGGHSATVGKQILNWQDTETVLRFFSSRRAVARQRYRRFVEKGINQGRRDDLTGGGLIRSAGGWSGHCGVSAPSKSQVNDYWEMALS
jgi:putative transposase